MSTGTAELFELGRQTLYALRAELAAYNIAIDPRLEVRQGAGLLCHYSLHDGHIYLSLPDPTTAQGKFKLLLYRALMNVDSNDEVMHLLKLFIPWLVAHEMGHHLRHKAGLFSADLWAEERIANQLAFAFIHGRLALVEKQEILAALAQALANYSGALDSTSTIDPELEPLHYYYAHMHWFHQDLLAQAAPTVAEFVQQHLRR
jgi:hypothetical protein